MSITKLIKPLLAFLHAIDPVTLTGLKAILTGMTNNAAYPSPPVAMPVFGAKIDSYSAAITAALDGSKKARAACKLEKAEVSDMVRLLAHYVQDNCNNNMATLLSSGFTAQSTTKAPPQPTSPPILSSVVQGNTGQALATIKRQAGAKNHELRVAALGAGAVPGAWTSVPVLSLIGPTAINGLTPGTTYIFQARGSNAAGLSDWSSSVERMLT